MLIKTKLFHLRIGRLPMVSHVPLGFHILWRPYEQYSRARWAPLGCDWEFWLGLPWTALGGGGSLGARFKSGGPRPHPLPSPPPTYICPMCGAMDVYVLNARRPTPFTHKTWCNWRDYFAPQS